MIVAPSSTNLPDNRVDFMHNSFHDTGLDFAGPLFIREAKNCLYSVEPYI